jgi:hypothetical protein
MTAVHRRVGLFVAQARRTPPRRQRRYCRWRSTPMRSPTRRRWAKPVLTLTIQKQLDPTRGEDAAQPRINASISSAFTGAPADEVATHDSIDHRIVFDTNADVPEMLSTSAARLAGGLDGQHHARTQDAAGLVFDGLARAGPCLTVPVIHMAPAVIAHVSPASDRCGA